MTANSYKHLSYKIIVNALLFLFAIQSCQKDKQRAYLNSKILFHVEEYDFGYIEMNEVYNFSFHITNIGSSPLVIQDIKANCGCVFAKWSKKPIESNKESTINVSYNASVPGQFIKTIKVFYNGEDSPKSIIIKGKTKYTKKIE